jgi:hypothetical protein
MTKFFINFRNANKVLAKDDEGQEFTGLHEARAAALQSAREILADNVKHPEITPLEAVIITNESGQKLATVHAKNILERTLNSEA